MRKIGGLLAAVLFCVSLAGSPAKAFSKKVTNKQFEGKIMAEAPKSFNVSYELKEVNGAKFQKSVKREFAKQASASKKFSTKTLGAGFERSSIIKRDRQVKNDFLC